MGMFDKPKTVAPAPKAKLAKQKTEVEIAGIEKLAMIKALEDTLKTLKETVESEVKAVAAERFAEEIARTGKRPDSFTAIEGGAHASVQLRRRSSAYGMSEEAIALLQSSGIEPHAEIVTPELFAINPAYAADSALLGKVEKALAKIVPQDFIVVQQQVVKHVASEETFDAVLRAVQNKKAPASLISVVSTIACGAKLKNTDLSAILDFVADMVGVDASFGAAAEQAQAKKLRVVK